MTNAVSAYAPPVKGLSESNLTGWKNLLKDRKKVESIKEDALKTVFHDTAPLSVRNARATHRAAYEYFVEEEYGVHTLSEKWNAATVVSWSKQYISGYVNVAKGRISEKIQPATLHDAKDALYWWATRFIPGFSQLYLVWHTEMAAHLHYIAIKENLQTIHRPRHNLTDAELALFWNKLSTFTEDIANWKQHYIAWVLAYMTAARPGSFTVANGYEKGASLSNVDETLVRDEDATLRWADIEFRRMEGGIAVKITFRYDKAHHDPHVPSKLDGKRYFTFIPSQTSRLEYDLSVLLLGLAYTRGLFPQTLDEILCGKEAIIPTQPDVAQQAVFVASDADGGLDPKRPMRVSALNPKLQSICLEVGLLLHNTMYSWRRTAIIETRRAEGTELAKEIAHHDLDGNSIFIYDNIGLGDLDVTAMRLGQRGLSREQVRTMFSQAATARYRPTTPTAPMTLKQRLREETGERMRHTGDYRAMEEQFKETLLRGFRLMEEPPVFAGYSAGRLRKAILDKARALPKTEVKVYDDMVEEIEQARERRSTRKAKIWNTVRKKVLSEIQQAHDDTLKDSKKSAKPSFGLHRVPNALNSHQSINEKQASNPLWESSVKFTKELEDAIESESEQEFDGMEQVDEEILEMNDPNSRQQPVAWSALPEDVVIQTDRDNDVVTPEQRTKFLRDFIVLEDQGDIGMIPCLRCIDDISCNEDSKQRTWKLCNLERHLNGDFHDRRRQLGRIYNIDRKNHEEIYCPICEDRITKQNHAFIRHIKKSHAERLW